jgi:phage FluMu protein Com
MDATIHCPHCNRDLTVPALASGHRARCPACREVFVVPSIDDSLDDTVCAWIEEDVTQFVETRHATVEQSLQEVAARPVPAHANGRNGRNGNGDSGAPVEPKQTRRTSRSTWPTQLSPAEQRRRVLRRTADDLDPEHPHGRRWEKLSPHLRQRLEVWTKYREGERFRHFYPDQDFGPDRLGIAGVVLTDQRLIYRKANHFGHAERWDADTAILINTRGDTAVLTLARGTNRDRMVRLTHDDAEQLAAALNRGGGFTVNHVDE